MKNDRKFNDISSDIFSKTETNKNKIVEKKTTEKKLEKLIADRDCYIAGVTKAGSKQGTDQVRENQSSSSSQAKMDMRLRWINPAKAK